MAFKLEEGKTTLINTIQKKLRHQDYKRVCELAERYTSYVTGENIEPLLIQFTPRENVEAFNQRVRLTQLITPYIASRVMTPMYKAGRTLAQKNLSWSKKEKTDEYKKRINDAIAIYYGDQSLDDYLSYRMVELDSTDPNSFIITELPPKSDDPNDAAKLPEPYPFEVNSAEAVNYQYMNNCLQFLVVLNSINNLNRYTIYLENDAIVAQQLTEDEFKNVAELYPKAEIVFQDPIKKDPKEVYILSYANHKAGRVPAIRIGTKKDLVTRNRTCVPLIHPAKAFFEKSIKTISEFDLTQTLHAFPQKITYDSVCPGDAENKIICINGKLPSGEMCSVCHGTGFQEHRTSQDILRVKMPNDLKDVVSLEHFIAYKNPPSDILEFMKKLGLYEYPELAIQSVYCSELFTMASIVKTATEKNIDLDSVYDALKPFTSQWSNVYKGIVNTMAAYLGVADGITVEHIFPKDFKMKPLTELLNDLQIANTGGAPSYVKQEINRDIAQKLYVDKPDELLKIEVKEKFFPFNGKTETEIATIIVNNLCTNRIKTLYANFDMIFEELDRENSTDVISFYKLAPDEIDRLLDAKVEDFMKDIDDDSAASRANSFNPKPDLPPNPDDTQDYNIGDSVALATDNSQPVEITAANPGPNGGTYTILDSAGNEQQCAGIDLISYEMQEML